jgi:CRP-like cAMP-binding protein
MLTPNPMPGLVPGGFRGGVRPASGGLQALLLPQKPLPPAMTQERRKAPQNRLLSVLHGDTLRYLPALELVKVEAGDVLWSHGDSLRYIYFPVDCILSLVCELRNGACSEVACIGNEGMVDVAAVLGDRLAGSRAQVERSGHAHRVPVEALRQAFIQHVAIQRLVLRYVRALFVHTAQLVVCNKHHSTEQQVCRHLLSQIDRIRSLELHTTHDRIAGMLGVRREGVTNAIGSLNKGGLIHTERNTIAVLDRGGLERRCCECYRVIRHGYDQLRGG